MRNIHSDACVAKSITRIGVRGNLRRWAFSCATGTDISNSAGGPKSPDISRLRLDGAELSMSLARHFSAANDALGVKGRAVNRPRWGSVAISAACQRCRIESFSAHVSINRVILEQAASAKSHGAEIKVAARRRIKCNQSGRGDVSHG